MVLQVTDILFCAQDYAWIVYSETTIFVYQTSGQSVAMHTKLDGDQSGFACWSIIDTGVYGDFEPS